MSFQFNINGFSSTDGVPGAYGIVKYGAGAQSAASIPLTLLLVHLGAGGTATPDQDIVQVASASDADTAFGAGWPLTRMCQAALNIPGVNVFGMPVAAAGGAAAAFITVTFTASGMTASGTYYFRIAGVKLQITINPTDTATDIAVAFKNAINQYPRLPVRVTNTAGVATVTAVGAGTWANTLIYFHDTRSIPAGSTAVVTNGGSVVTGGGIPFSGAGAGTGTENVTTALAILLPQHYDRIGIGQVDATNLGRWRTQLQAQAGVLNGNIQFAVAAANGTFSAASSLGQTTLNDQLFQMVWLLNSETPACEIAATVAAMRTAAEQADPDAAYDYVQVPGIAPQSQAADRPLHATLVSAINGSVTACTTTDDGRVVIVRSVTTRSLNGATPDFATRDTGQAVVPAFCLKDILLNWTTDFQPNNPRVMDNPGPNDPVPPPGVAYPDLWNARVTSKLRDYEAGKIGGTTIPPIIINVSAHLPASSYDSIADRIMTVAPVKVAPVNHQIGTTILQTI